MVFSLPGRQSGFEELARSAAARRGAPLSEAAMMQLAQGMGAEDPFPIGMQFSNDQPVAKPLTKEQQARANMAAVMAQLAGAKEQGIAKYEQGVADKQLARERIPRSSEGMTGIDEVANAAYRQRSAQARDDNARSMAPLAQVLAQVSQQSGPQGNLWRRDPRAAIAYEQMKSASEGDAADRADRMGLAREKMGSDREQLMMQLAAQSGLAGDRMGFEKSMADLARQAAAIESEKQRGFISEQNAGNQVFQSGENRVGREATAKDAAEARANQLAIAEMQGKQRSEASQDDLMGNVMNKVMTAASTLPPEQYNMIKPQLAEAMAMLGNRAPAMASQTVSSPLAQDRFRQKYPSQLAAWDTASTGEGGTKKSMRDFLKSLPAEDIKGNIDALREYLGLRYQGKDVDKELTQWLGDPTEINRVRSAAGMNPTSGMSGMERQTERAVGDILLGTNPFTAPAYWGGKKLGWY